MKRLCAKAALDLVPDHGIIGLGGGETISYLAEYIKEAGKDIKVVTPSDKTAQVCKKLGLEIIDTKEVKEIAIAFDGCDQVDSNLDAYKSGGGIHTLEKIIAKMAKEYVLLVDETKVIDKLNNKVPIVLDIIPEAINHVTSQVEKFGATVKKRDEHLLEVYFDSLPELEEIDRKLKLITGVVEISLFYQIATKALVAGESGIRVIE